MKNILFISLALFLLPSISYSEEKIIRIYQDADLSSHKESSEAIQKGIEVAFSEIDNEVAGYKVEFKYLDHGGNVVKSKQNYEKFLKDDKALAIYSGIHSPPLIKNRTFINENDALTLIPWAAGGPITRYPSKENWVFRLSVDDTKAGPVIIDHAINKLGCKNPHLLLEQTPWGDSNLKSMSKALKGYEISNPKTTRFGWSLKGRAARVLIREIMESDSDCIVLVANAVEGVEIVQAALDVEEANTIPIVSHWGITGGNFHKKINAEKRKNLDLSFIQSCFAFTNKKQTELSKKVFEKLKKHSVEIKKPEDLKSAVGFIHAYDLTKLLIQAISQAGISGEIKKDRNSIRLALEDLRGTIQGLVKNYEKPYSVFDNKTNFDGHEALGVENYCMAQYGDKNEILILGK